MQQKPKAVNTQLQQQTQSARTRIGTSSFIHSHLLYQTNSIYRRRS